MPAFPTQASDSSGVADLGRRLKDRWDDLVDRVAGWLQPEPELVPVPVRRPSPEERRGR